LAIAASVPDLSRPARYGDINILVSVLIGIQDGDATKNCQAKKFNLKAQAKAWT